MKKIFYPENINLNVLKKIQIETGLKVSLKNKFHNISEIKTISSFDVSYKNNLIKVGGGIFEFPSLKIKNKICKVFKSNNIFPYIPGYLSFRESPPILNILKNLTQLPDLIIFDGQGIAHPRKAGIASHIGVILNIPTIGCAKSVLYGKFDLPENKKGSYRFIYNESKEKIGVALRTKENVKPVFISPGNLIDFQMSKEIILKTITKYRIPEPLRFAHQIANS